MTTNNKYVRILGFILIASLLSLSYGSKPALASVFGVFDTTSSTRASQTNVSHELTFTVPSTSSLQELQLRFSDNSEGFSKPASLDLTGATLASGTIFGLSGWSLDTSSASSGLLKITRADSAELASTSGTITLNNITNPNYDDCEVIAGTLASNCYIMLTTHATSSDPALDNGTGSFRVSEDPMLSFTVSGVSKGETHNGITTTVATTDSTLHFGNIAAESPQYAAHKLTIRTNAPHGYTVFARLEDGMYGMYNDNKIDPFSAFNVTWLTPQLWSKPNGTTPNNNTGWIGANTSDTRVEGWHDITQNKFGPISAINHAVAYSSSPELTDKDVYVTYALEVNGIQPSDDYTTSIVYNVQASY